MSQSSERENYAATFLTTMEVSARQQNIMCGYQNSQSEYMSSKQEDTSQDQQDSSCFVITSETLSNSKLTSRRNSNTATRLLDWILLHQQYVSCAMLFWSAFSLGLCIPTIISLFGSAWNSIKQESSLHTIGSEILRQNCFINLVIFNASLAGAIFVSSVLGDRYFRQLSTTKFSKLYITFAIAELICVVVILFSALQQLACDNKTQCPGDDIFEFAKSETYLVTLYFAISGLGIFHGLIQARYISQMPHLSCVPRTMQTAAFFQRSAFQNLGYMGGAAIQLLLITRLNLVFFWSYDASS